MKHLTGGVAAPIIVTITRHSLAIHQYSISCNKIASTFNITVTLPMGPLSDRSLTLK
jgi:hypothetical protein